MSIFLNHWLSNILSQEVQMKTDVTIYIYIYIYVYIYMYIYVYICIYISSSRWLESPGSDVTTLRIQPEMTSQNTHTHILLKI